MDSSELEGALLDEKEAERRVPGLARCQKAILNTCEALRQSGHSPSAVLSALIGSTVTVVNYLEFGERDHEVVIGTLRAGLNALATDKANADDASASDVH